MNPMRYAGGAGGFGLIEVLVTVLIILMGLLGLAGLQGYAISSETDAHQRAQALLLLQDMSDRINANRKNAASYVTNPSGGTATPRGTGYNNSQPLDCSALSGANLDLCEWHNALLGVSETRGTKSVGAMVAARGCVYQLNAGDPTTGVPAQYMVSVAWKGMRKLGTPTVDCGTGQYDNETFRRTLTVTLDIAQLKGSSGS